MISSVNEQGKPNASVALLTQYNGLYNPLYCIIFYIFAKIKIVAKGVH